MIGFQMALRDLCERVIQLKNFNLYEKKMIALEIK